MKFTFFQRLIEVPFREVDANLNVASSSSFANASLEDITETPCGDLLVNATFSNFNQILKGTSINYILGRSEN